MSWRGKEEQLYTEAAADPESVFDSPEELRDNRVLTVEHKIDLLRRWAHEVLDIQVADEENMTGKGTTELFDRIMVALHDLGADLEEHRSNQPSR